MARIENSDFFFLPSSQREKEQEKITQNIGGLVFVFIFVFVLSKW